MRKPSKAKIAAALDEYIRWANFIGPQIEAIEHSGARRYFRHEMAAIRQRIESGDLGWSTHAHSSHVVNTVKWWHRGLFSDCEWNETTARFSLA